MNDAGCLLTRLGAFIRPRRKSSSYIGLTPVSNKKGNRFGSESLALAVILQAWDEGPQAYPEESRNTPLHLPQSMKSRLVPMAANAR